MGIRLGKARKKFFIRSCHRYENRVKNVPKFFVKDYAVSTNLRDDPVARFLPFGVNSVHEYFVEQVHTILTNPLAFRVDLYHEVGLAVFFLLSFFP